MGFISPALNFPNGGNLVFVPDIKIEFQESTLKPSLTK
jgi:hypothetical protein